MLSRTASAPCPASAGPFFTRASTPCSAIRGKCSSIVNRRRALHQRADRGTVQPQDEVPFPVTRHRPVAHFCWPLADHDLRHDESLAPTPGARPRYAQRTPGAQAGRQLASQGPTALYIKRLVDGFVADAHHLIMWKVE